VVSVAYIPSWLPGGRYKQRAGECRALARRVLDDPVDYVKDSMVGLLEDGDSARSYFVGGWFGKEVTGA